MLALQRRFWGRRSLAVATMTTLMLVVIVLPFWVAISTVLEHVDKVGAWTSALQTFDIPSPPAFVEGIPFIGAKIAALWSEAALQGWGPLAAKLQPYLVQIAKWVGGEVGTLGALVVQFLLTVVVAAVLYAKGEATGAAMRRFGRRLAGRRGEDSIRLAGQAVRAVALGVVVTALAQALLAGLGLYFANIPFAGGLTLAILLLCVAQVGVLPVMIPAVGWLYLSGNNMVGSLLLVWTVIVATSDNVMRAFLIKRGGADLPLLLIFAGVIGGLISFGLLGIFVGPVVLAVSYTLLSAWVNEPGDPTVDEK
jgi:predicted PurR-regulated permease PerM